MFFLSISLPSLFFPLGLVFFSKSDEIQQEATVEPNKNTTNEKLVDEDKMAEREEATGNC